MMKEHKYKSKVILIFLLFFLSIIELHPHNFFTSPQENWTAYVLYVKDGKVPVLKNPSDETDTINFVYYRDKVLVVDKEWETFGWKKIVYPINGFIQEKSLMTLAEKIKIDVKSNNPIEENEYSKWSWEIISCSNDYVLVKTQKNEASETVGLLIDNEKAILIKEQFNFQSTWVRTAYPFQGYIKYLDAFKGKRDPYLALGITYGAKHIPYEKNLNNYFNPLGGYLEYGKANWNPGFRIGYNHAESRLSSFFIKTDQVYFHLLYKIFRLFNEKLETYALAGANYWFSSFENKKYGSDNSYFKLEKDSGPGYVVGAGLIYNLGIFFIEAQYISFWSRQAEFGSKPVQGSFSNYSTLYPGSNHIEIIFGYRIVL